MPHDCRDFMASIQRFLQNGRSDKAGRADQCDLHV
jgi:hypothetical protein